MTKAAGQANSDPVLGEQMISRDRYHPHDTQAAAHPQPADHEPAGHQAADQANAAAEPVADSRSAATGQDGDTTDPNTEPVGNQRSDTSDNEQGQGLEVYVSMSALICTDVRSPMHGGQLAAGATRMLR